MSIGSGVTQVFNQLGILEELKAIGKPSIAAHIYNANQKPLLSLDFSERADL